MDAKKGTCGTNCADTRVHSSRYPNHPLPPCRPEVSLRETSRICPTCWCCMRIVHTDASHDTQSKSGFRKETSADRLTCAFGFCSNKRSNTSQSCHLVVLSVHTLMIQCTQHMFGCWFYPQQHNYHFDCLPNIR